MPYAFLVFWVGGLLGGKVKGRVDFAEDGVGQRVTAIGLGAAAVKVTARRIRLGAQRGRGAEVADRGGDLVFDHKQRLLAIREGVEFGLRRAAAMQVKFVHPDLMESGADLFGGGDREVHKDIQGHRAAGRVNPKEKPPDCGGCWLFFGEVEVDREGDH